jgi:hypothetical protein
MKRTTQQLEEYARLAGAMTMTCAFLRGMQVINKFPHDTGLELTLNLAIRSLDRVIDLLEKGGSKSHERAEL